MPPRTRLLQVIEATTGGTRHHLLDLVSALDKEQFAVSVICSDLRDKTFRSDIEAMRSDGIDVTVIQMVRHISPLRDLSAFLRILRHMKRGNFSVVHTHSSKAGFLGRIAAKCAGIPVVIHTPHVLPFEMDTGAVRKAMYFLLERIAARCADRIVCVSPSQKELAVRKGLADPDRLVVIENGIRASDYVHGTDRRRARAELGIEGEGLTVGLIGRFTRQKGQRYLLDAARQVLDKAPATRFVLVGDGETKVGLQKLAGKLGILEGCLFLEPRDDIAMLISAFDVIAIPSLWEGLPYIMLEAMAAGSAVVASRVGGIPDVIVSGETGLLVAPKDAGALARAIHDLLGDSDLRERLGSAAKNAVQSRPAQNDMVRATAELYVREGVGGDGRG